MSPSFEEPGPDRHPFVKAPHRTFFLFSMQVLISLVAEPVTGLVDTAFVARLGAVPLAALGVGSIVLSGCFWIFNFLGIGTQTQVANAQGRSDTKAASGIGSLALLLGLGLGLLLAMALWLGARGLVSVMGAGGPMESPAVLYLKIRALGAPAILVSLAGFGVLRGLLDMRTPLLVAGFVNLLNILLDWIFIFGAGPIPPMGISGAAGASAFSQWVGAAWIMVVVWRKMGMRFPASFQQVTSVFKVGADLFVRTGLLLLFLVLATRSATRLGPEAGAVHQVIRQCWVFSAFILDAYGITAQSVVGYFIGAHLPDKARFVARVTCIWSFATGILLTILMILLRPVVELTMVPLGARSIFQGPWLVMALFQPVNALAFATDGLHWGSGDFPFLRNAMILCFFVGTAFLALQNPLNVETGLAHIWGATGAWICTRALFGLLRIWPGIGNSPFQTP